MVLPGKDTLLGVLQQQLETQALEEIAEGKLVGPRNLDEVCGRLIPAWRKSPLTWGSLKSFGVTDEDLREVVEKALKGAGVEMLSVRDVTAQRLFYTKYPPSNDTLAYNLRWEDIPFDGCSSSQPFYDEADQIISKE